MFGFKKKQQPYEILRTWDTAPHKGVAHFTGTCDSNCFYTYNYDPIKDLRLGTEVTIEAVAADVILKTENDFQKFTDDSWGVVYSLDGVIVGVTKAKAAKIRELMKDGYTVRIDAVVEYDAPIKMKTLMLGYSDMTIE